LPIPTSWPTLIVEVEQLAVALRASLCNGGLVRAAGVNGLVIAATAIVHDAVVVRAGRLTATERAMLHNSRSRDMRQTR
jgi:hypothetical protein